MATRRGGLGGDGCGAGKSRDERGRGGADGAGDAGNAGNAGGAAERGAGTCDAVKRGGEGWLAVVGTPIGNLADISPRAVEALREADVVCAEDTRVTGMLLKRLGVEAKLERCDENVIASRAPRLVERISAGERIAFCSDAGMPGVCDPGAVLVDACLDAGLCVSVVPGPSAVTCALAASGFATSSFYFGGFLPRKDAARQRLLASLAPLAAALVFYESPHRTASALESIAQAFPARQACVARELTKLHEEVVRKPLPELVEWAQDREQSQGGIKGEVVVVVAPPTGDERQGRASAASTPTREDALAKARQLMAQGESKSRIAKQLSQELGIPKNAIYDLLHEGPASF